MQSLFEVPESKKIRLIINTDAKNEADDQFAIVHALLTKKFIIRGIIAAHFERKHGEGKEQSMDKSHAEIRKILGLMKMEKEVPAFKGARRPMVDEKTPEMSEGAEFIIREALSDDPRPLYAGFMGTLTDLAAAYLREPRIAERLNVIWIGGGEWPVGGWEFNLNGDVDAANVVFRSRLNLWQIPMNVYRMMRVTLSELACKVRPCGEIGKYLFQQMVDYNNEYADSSAYPGFPMGESWVLGDSPVIGALIVDHHHEYDVKPAPLFARDLTYIHGQNNRAIRVFKGIDARMTLEDMYCKLAMLKE
jgi:inosine-uridine nucleoside N-ribohydrolase